MIKVTHYNQLLSVFNQTHVKSTISILMDFELNQTQARDLSRLSFDSSFSYILYMLQAVSTETLQICLSLPQNLHCSFMGLYLPQAPHQQYSLYVELQLPAETSHILTQTLGIFLYSLLAYVPEDKVDQVTINQHQSTSYEIHLSALTWSCQLRVSQNSYSKDPHCVFSNFNQDKSVHTVSLNHTISQLELSEISWDLARKERWIHLQKLVIRAWQNKGIAQSYSLADINTTAFLHQSVAVQGDVKIGAHTKIWHFSKLLGPLTIGEHCSLGQNVVVERGVSIGNQVKIQNNVSIYSGVILEDDVFCGPSMVFTNVGTPRSHYPRRGEYQETRIQKGASIGANATIVCGHTLGRYCFVGAGSVVTKDIPDYALVYGNPARIRAWACYCGIKLDLKVDKESSEDCVCQECKRTYHREGLRVQILESDT
jgi:UDP-2-acetamido-3-amino-2,3-dideoxy-glucuronate N-acetyltransferase